MNEECGAQPANIPMILEKAQGKRYIVGTMSIPTTNPIEPFHFVIIRNGVLFTITDDVYQARKKKGMINSLATFWLMFLVFLLF